MRGGRFPVIVAVLVLASCGVDGGPAPVASNPEVVGEEVPSTTTESTVPPESPTTTPTSTASTAEQVPPATMAVLRPDGLGPVDFGASADDTIAGLSELFGPPDQVERILPTGPGDAGCVEGSSWVDCVRDLRLIEQGQIADWSQYGLTVALVDTDGRTPHEQQRPLQFGDWHATRATGDAIPVTAEGLYPGMRVRDVRRAVGDVTFAYNEGILDAVAVDVPDGGYFGWLDWSQAEPSNEWSELVRVVQVALNDHGADLVVDGEWGPRSQTAWEEFLGVRRIEPPSTMWLTPEIGAALGLQPDEFILTTLEPLPMSPPAGTAPSGLVLRPAGLGSFDFGDPAEKLVADMAAAFGPSTGEVVFSAQPPDRLYMPGGYQALHDLVQYEWSDPAFLVILSDTPFRGDHWDEPVPGTLHLTAWETSSGQLTLDTGVTVGSTLAQLSDAYRDVSVGNYDVCETDYEPAAFTAPATFPLHGTLNWDWVTDLQLALSARGATLDADGMYGPATTDAVQQFQQTHGIDGGDGRIGPATMDALALTAPDTAPITDLSAGYPGSC